MKTGTSKEFFELFYRAHRMAAKGKDPMDTISEAIGLAYQASNDEVMMCRLHDAKFRANIALLSRETHQLSLSTRLSLHKVGCPF